MGGLSYIDNTCWDDEEEKTCYFNDTLHCGGGGRYATRFHFETEENFKIFEFSEVDFSGVLKSEEIMDIEKMLEEERLKKNSEHKKITLNEFWEAKKG